MTAFAWNAAAFEPETPETAEEMAVSETAALTDEAQYAAKPAATDAALGTLIYFDNGNSTDTVNSYNITLGGLANTTTDIGGYKARAIDTTDNTWSDSYGIYVTLSDKTKKLTGKLTLCVELFNNVPAVSDASSNYRAFWDVDSNNMNAYSNRIDCTMQKWTTLKTKPKDTGLSIMGVKKASKADCDKMLVRSVYVYYAPAAAYAAKPAENDPALGELIYFDNGNTADTLNKYQITFGGLANTITEIGGYKARAIDTTDNTWNSVLPTGPHGVYVTLSDETKKLTGKLTFCAELFNNLPAVSDASKNYRGFFEYISQTSNSGIETPCTMQKWTTLKNIATADAATCGFIGFRKASNADFDKMLVRSVYVYYKPYEITTSEQTSIRVTGNAGIRFRGSVSAATLASADEAGFIIARGDLLTAGGYNAADEVKISGAVTEKENNPGSFSAKTANGFALAGARNYKKDSIDKLTPDVEGGYDFTGVVINLQKPYTADGVTYANRYAIPLVGRAYVKIGSLYYYGDCTTASMKDVAEKIKQSGSDTYTENQEYIDTVIATAGAKAE